MRGNARRPSHDGRPQMRREDAGEDEAAHWDDEKGIDPPHEMMR